MIITTTNSVDGKVIAKYLGIVGQTTDKVINRRHDRLGFAGAQDDIVKQAKDLGADAIVGLQVVGPTEQIYGTVHLYGTAVKFK